MADLRNDIGAIASNLGATFYFGRKHEVNADGDNLNYPAIILLEPDSGAFTISPTSGGITDTNDTFIQFVTKVDEISQFANYRYPEVEQMKALARSFVYELQRKDIWQAMNAINPWALIVDTYDVNVVGIELNLGRLTNIFPEPC